MVCVKDLKKDANAWKLHAIPGNKIDDMVKAGDAIHPGTKGLDPLCHKEVARRVQEVDTCQRSGTGFVLYTPPDDEELLAAPKKKDDDGENPDWFLPGMTLWEWAVSETPWPDCWISATHS